MPFEALPIFLALLFGIDWPDCQVLLLTGTVKATDSQEFLVPKTSSWRLQLKWMAEEGAMVRTGDPVVRFDRSTLAKEADELEARLLDLMATFRQQEAEQDQQISDADAAVYEAEINLKKAQLDLTIPQELTAAIDRENRRIDHARAVQALKQKRREAQHARVKAQAAMAKLRMDEGEIRDALARKRKLLSRMTLLAKRDGPVVHRDHPWEGRKIRPGDMVRPSWVVAEIPASTGLQIQAWVNEVDVHKCRPGQDVRLYFDALRDMESRGRVRSIGVNPEEKWLWGSGGYHEVLVDILNPIDAQLIPGMSVQAHVVIQDRLVGRKVPIESVTIDRDSVTIETDSSGRAFRLAGINAFFVYLEPLEGANP